MNLFQKILVAPSIAVVFMLILGGVGYQSLRSQNHALDDLLNSRSDHLRVAFETKSGVLDVHSRVYRLMTWAGTFDESKLDKEGKALGAEVEKISGTFTRWLGEPDLTDEEKALGTQIGGLIAKYNKSITQAIDLAAVDMNTGLSAMQTADENFSQLARLTDDLVVLEQKLGKAEHESARTAYYRALTVGVIVLLAAIALSAGLSFTMARSIAGRVAEASRIAGRVAAGDLTSSIPQGGKDEVGNLLLALQHMQDDLRAVIGSIVDGAGKLERSAGDMSSSASQISRAAQEQSASISSTAATVEQMTVSIAQVSDNADAARDIAQRTASFAENGKQLVVDAATEINRIAESVGATTQAMQELQTSSQEISNIANVIREIAEQTNLLALNAAIEAARAGEQGRGFAVVADEVRKLAERTGSSTNEIKSMIQTIQAQTDHASSSMEQASQRVAAGVRMIQDLQAPLQELSTSSSRALSSLVELSDATKEQSRASTGIAQNVERIAQMGEENSNAAAHSNDLAQELSRLSGSLRDVVGRFRG